ncbi:MAG TPA: N-acetylmuramoyl-L-alanine amidase [Bryobacteraceae bacterium]|nr:N-acetylmuramoyl-L-alanine amidase [Bryobacteraceae bacterium]
MFGQHQAAQAPRFMLNWRREPALSDLSVRRLLLGTLLLLLLSMLIGVPAVVSDVSVSDMARIRGADVSADVWLVEETPEYQLYSNGLRLENAYLTTNTHRFYQVLDRQHGMQPSTTWSSQPVGIIFHTTESPAAPFTAADNDALRRCSAGLLATVRNRQSYNFVVDRFGRVFRVVEELDAANHAGNSVWANGSHVWLNVNNSFLAIAFEATTPAGGIAHFGAAQLHSGRLLTQLLRGRYGIAAENCVTHAQVSVNPDNMRIGYHTDGAAGFPFRELGLPNNYELPLPSLTEFGFEYDDTFRAAMGASTWNGIVESERLLERAAAQTKLAAEEHRSRLRDRYRRLYAALKLTGAMDERAQP